MSTPKLRRRPEALEQGIAAAIGDTPTGDSRRTALDRVERAYREAAGRYSRIPTAEHLRAMLEAHAAFRAAAEAWRGQK